MTNYSNGHEAEKVAAQYLIRHGWIIKQLNWRTTWCEIDIVAVRDNSICFFEVKYRKSDWQGSGFDYITPRKIAQMSRSAESWVQAHNWKQDYYLGAIELSGPDYAVTNVLYDVDL
ncbi:MAG: YraN family protein [Candidatus Saccharibacteria bacterium]